MFCDDFDPGGIVVVMNNGRCGVMVNNRYRQFIQLNMVKNGQVTKQVTISGVSYIAD